MGPVGAGRRGVAQIGRRTGTRLLGRSELFASGRLYTNVERRLPSCQARANHIGQLLNRTVYILGWYGVQFYGEGNTKRPACESWFDVVLA